MAVISANFYSTTVGSFIEGPNPRSMPEMFHEPAKTNGRKSKRAAGWFAVQLAIAAQPNDMRANVAESFRRTSTGWPASASGAIQSATCVQGGGPETHSDVRSSAASK